ncbi:MAG TPA: hypothetical protein VHI11_04010 [Jiangellaceae bacterium]|nr:hypothetical protein [Jiangellaceae bacterium]
MAVVKIVVVKLPAVKAAQCYTTIFTSALEVVKIVVVNFAL